QTALTHPEAPTYIPDEAIIDMRAKVVEALVKEIGREGFAIAATSAKGYSAVNDRAVRDMLADLVLDQQTWQHDFATQPGERIRSTMMRHLDALTVLLCEPEKVKGMLTGPAKEMVGSALEAVKTELGSGEMMQYLSPASAPLVRAKLEKTVVEAPGSTLQKLEDAVSDVTRRACAKLQKLASHSFEKMLGGQSSGGMDQIFSDIEREEQQEALFEASIEGKSPQEKERLRLYNAQGIDPEMSISAFLLSPSGSERLMKLPFSSNSASPVVNLAMTLDTPEHRITMDAFCQGRTFEEAFTAFAREHHLELKPLSAREEIGNKSLDDLVGSGALDTKSGYGRFMVNVMQRYFAGVSEIDQRSMLSSMIRFATEESVAPTDSEQVRDQKNRANVARQLGALFKGAGPIMQKLLQQLGSSSVAPEFKLALQDMKCNLLPIPDSIVRTQLNGIIDRSGGAIAQIRVDKSLGAASVGQSLLCTLIGSDGSERPVVIKLLRPDVDTRMEREKDIFLEAARSVPGMEETYLGRLERLMEELDLRIEANNCKLGAAYDKSLKLKEGTYNDVHAMKLDPSVETTKDVMVLERAPGTTVANYMEDVKEKVAALKLAVETFQTSETRLEALRTLDTLRSDLLRHQQEVSRLAFKWVEEGMFKDGFYHGDLHAGNIMVDTREGPDNKGLTVIDFGNATKLTASDQRRIMRMVYAANDKQPDLFLDNYRKLMKPEHQAAFDAQRTRAREFIALIFSKGDETQVGERISAALMQMQKLGLELPGQIFNFSQCQLLIQGTVTQMNEQIKAIDDARRALVSDLDDPATGDQYLSRMVGWFDAEHRDTSLVRLDDKAQDYEARALGLREASRALREFLLQIDDRPDDAQIKLGDLPEGLRSIVAARDGNRTRIGKDELSELLSRFDGMAVQYETYVRHWRDLSRAEHETPGTLALQLSAHNSVTQNLQQVQTARRSLDHFLKAGEKFLETVRHMPEGMSVASECNIPSAARMLLKSGRVMRKDEFLAFARSVKERPGLTPQQLNSVSTAIANASRMGEDWTYHDRIILPETVKLGENAVFNKRNIVAAVQTRLADIAQATDEARVNERAKLEKILTDTVGYADEDYLGISPSIPQDLQGKLDSSLPRDKRSVMAALESVLEAGRREREELQTRSQSLQESDNGFADSKLFSFALMAGECEANDVTLSREFGTGGYPKYDRVQAPEPQSFVRTMSRVILNNSWASARAVGIGTAIKSLF
ncbi:MAG: AarF/UbiB family protein, partial [Duodenibacillus sp.]